MGHVRIDREFFPIDSARNHQRIPKTSGYAYSMKLLGTQNWFVGFGTTHAL